MSNYWKNREIVEREHLLDITIADTEAALRKEYQRAYKKIHNQMSNLYDKLLNADGEVLANNLYTYNRYYEMLNNLNSELTKLGGKANNILEKRFTDLYMANSKIVGKSFNLQSNISTDAAKRVVNQIWVDDGLKWSDRIWKQKTQLTEALRKGLVDCVATGASKDKLTTSIMNIFGTGYNEASRLARTELAHIQVQSTMDKYKEAGITQYRVLVAEDERLCDECGERNEKVYPMSDTYHLPPSHPNCRCTILAVLE